MMNSVKEFETLQIIIKNLDLIQNNTLYRVLGDSRENGGYDIYQEKLYIHYGYQSYEGEESLNEILRHELIHHLQFKFNILWYSSLEEELNRYKMKIDLNQVSYTWDTKYHRHYTDEEKRYEIPAFYLQKKELFWKLLKEFSPNWTKLIPTNTCIYKYKELEYSPLFGLKVFQNKECYSENPYWIIELYGKFYKTNYYGGGVKDVLKYIFT